MFCFVLLIKGRVAISHVGNTMREHYYLCSNLQARGMTEKVKKIHRFWLKQRTTKEFNNKIKRFEALPL